MEECDRKLGMGVCVRYGPVPNYVCIGTQSVPRRCCYSATTSRTYLDHKS